MPKEIRYYTSFETDFSQSANQHYTLEKGYKYIRTDLLSRIKSVLVYTGALIFSSVYCRVGLHIKFVKPKGFYKKIKNGAFLFANHTQPIGDVFNPALAVFPKRIYTIASPANYGIRVIGKILPYLGAIPLERDLSMMKEFVKAVEHRANEGNVVVVYPEAHVWEYYDKIRPFPNSSFKFPIKLNKPIFVATSTYQKRAFFKKPKMVIYIDEINVDKTLSKNEQIKLAHTKAYECMCSRAKMSNCEYIKYEKAL